MRRASIALVVFCALVTMVPVAESHALLTASDPRSGARLEIAPDRVVLRFTSLLDQTASSFDVVDQNGTRVNTGRITVSNEGEPHMESLLRADLPDGAYLIRWRAVSGLDGHLTQGSIGFAVGAYEPPTSIAPSLRATTASPQQLLLRTAVYAGVSLALGGSWAALRFDRDARWHRRIVIAGALLQAVGAAGLASAVRPIHLDWGAFLSGPAGIWYGARVLAGVIVTFLLWRPRQGSLPAALFTILVAVWGAARTSHTANYGILGTLLDGLHLTSSAAWAGGLLMFLVGAVVQARGTQGTADVAAMANRWSKDAVPVVTVMVATGLLLEMALLGPRASLDTAYTARSAYGGFVLAKLALAVLAILASLGARYLYGLRTEDGWKFRSPTLRSIIAGQVIVAFVILGLAGAMAGVGPPMQPQADAPQDDAKVLNHDGQSQSFRATMELKPAPVSGEFSTFTFRVSERANGASVVNDTCGRSGCLYAAIVYTSSNESGPENRILRPTNDGRWSGDPYLFVLSGGYKVTLTIQTEYVYLETIDFTVRVV
jgi:putative copper export protein/methionine-rich copper-binding protein CopC